MIKRFLLPVSALATVLLIVLITSGCQKSARVRWVYYDETQCSDKWVYTINNEVLKENITTYLDSKGVDVYEIEIFRLVEAETCTACNCKSGRQIKCKIKKGDLDNALNEGFYE